MYADRPLEEALVGVSALGFEYVDVAAVPGWAHVEPAALADDPAARERVAAAAQAAGVRIVALNAGLGATGEEAVARCRALAETALDLGARVVTLQPPPSSVGFSEAVEELTSIADVGRENGLAISLEIHRCSITELPNAAARLAAATGLGLTLDPSHLVAGPAHGEGLETVLPYVDHVHVRDAGRGSELLQLPMGAGVIDFPALFDRLATLGYEGALSIEYIGRADELPAAVDAVDAARAVRAWWPGALAGAGAFV